MAPEELRLKPGGRLPLITAKVLGPTLAGPEAVSVSEYGVFTGHVADPPVETIAKSQAPPGPAVILIDKSSPPVKSATTPVEEVTRTLKGKLPFLLSQFTPEITPLEPNTMPFGSV